MKIVREFLEGLELPVEHADGEGLMTALVEDVRLSGSLAGYNWSKYSDVDVHIVVDFSKIDENTVGHKTISSGIYSIANDDWVEQPDPTQVEIDFDTAQKKSDDIETQISHIEPSIDDEPREALDSIKRLKKKIRKMRLAGLDSPAQEYSAENIAFKILRREELLDKLNNMKYDVYDKILSMGE